jgi:hypothetical protein
MAYVEDGYCLNCGEEVEEGQDCQLKCFLVAIYGDYMVFEPSLLTETESRYLSEHPWRDE